MTTDTAIDYDALWTKAAADHKDANERFQKASADSADAAFRAVVFAAMTHNILTLTLGSSDQGEYMLLETFTDASGEFEGYDLEDDLWAVQDLPDHFEADWTNNDGVTSAFKRSGTEVTIDVPAAAAALLERES